MIIESGSNAQYTSADNKSITLTIVTDTLGTIPISVHPDDVPTAQIYADCVAGKYGAIAAYPLASSQSTQLALMDSSYTSANTQPISYMNTTFQADDYSVNLLNQTIQIMTSTSTPNLTWWDSNNNGVAMTLAQLVGLGAEIFSRGQTLFTHKQTQKSAIRAATTNAAVEAITW